MACDLQARLDALAEYYGYELRLEPYKVVGWPAEVPPEECEVLGTGDTPEKAVENAARRLNILAAAPY